MSEHQSQSGEAVRCSAVVRRYEVWFEPTEKGAKVFGWKPGRTVNAVLSLEDAQFECYVARNEEAHDFGEYGRYVVREVTPTPNS